MEKIDQILESLYDRVIEPVEAKEQLLLLFGVIKSVCDCERSEDIYRVDVYKCGKCHLKVPI